MNNIIVRNIISSDINGYSRVTLANDLFNAVRGIKPELPYEGMGDSAGHGVRVFNIGDTNLYVSYDKETQKNIFIMKTKDANKKLVTIDQERAKEPKLPFDIASFMVA